MTKPIHDDAYQFMAMMNSNIARVQSDLFKARELHDDALRKMRMTNAVLALGPMMPGGADAYPETRGLKEAGEATVEYTGLIVKQTEEQLVMLERQRDSVLRAFD